MIPGRIRIVRLETPSKSHRRPVQMLPCIATCHLHLLVIAHVDDSLLELPSRDPAVEQDVKLAVRAVLELGQEEVGHDPADESSAAPNVATLASHVPAGGVEHLRREVDHRNFCNLEFC